MRDMAGIRQSRLTDAAVRLPVKAIHAFLHSNITVRMLFMNFIAPQAVPVAAPAILGIPPLSDKVWEVREAQQRFGFDIPAEAHKEFRAKQHERVFEKGEKPSEEGLVESQAHIGALDVHNAAKVG
jgi:hypothetical protein